MRRGFASLLAGLALASVQLAVAQPGNMELPKSVAAGSAFSIQTGGTGKAVLYIVGMGQALKQDVQLGGETSFPAGSLYNAGPYLAILVGSSSTDKGVLNVMPASQPVHLSFLAKPSRLSVGRHNGISGTVYVFDAYHNLITAPTPVTFELSNPSGAVEQHTAVTHNGAGWTEMDSTPKEGNDKFVAHVGGLSSTRIVEQVPGDPCGLKMTAQPSGKTLDVKTAPVLDCSGNPVPDGTIVTFTESYDGKETTVDVPLKRGIAQVDMPDQHGARISVASGVVLGNEIRWR